MKTIRTARTVALATILLMGAFTIGAAMAQGSEAMAHGGAAATAALEGGLAGGSAAPYYAAALVMGLACLSAAYAVGKVGAAALGAAAEKPELLGKAIVFVGLGEGIAIFGLIISLMIINKIQ